MSIPEVQVAFQGGGAMLLAMLPVAEAFRFCHDQKIVEIKAVSGASAGSLCAGLIAADCDFTKLRAHILATGHHSIAALFGDRAAKLRDLMTVLQSNPNKAEIGVQAFLSWTALKDVAIRGYPILEENELQKFIEGLLRQCRIRQKLIEDLPISLKVVVTDLRTSDSETRSAGNLSDTLFDSCAYPIALRSFSRRPPNVDGGLSDNLPVDCLLGDGSAPIFAVFPKPPETAYDPKHVLDYLDTLFAAAITSKVNAAKRKVRKTNQFEIAAEFSTFDFEAALSCFGRDGWYEKIRDGAIQRIKAFAELYGSLHEAHWFRYDDIETIGRFKTALINLTHDDRQNFTPLYSRMVVEVQCGRVVSDASKLAEDREPDIIVRTVGLRVGDAFRTYKSKLTYQTDDQTPSIWRAHNLTRNKPMSIQVLSLERKPSRKAGQTDETCLVQFINPATEMSAGDTIEIIDTTHARMDMKGLNLGTGDFVRNSNDYDFTIKTLELELHYPRTLGTHRAVLDPEPTSVKDQAEYTPNVGARMLRIAALGWRATNLEPGQSLKFMAVRK